MDGNHVPLPGEPTPQALMERIGQLEQAISNMMQRPQHPEVRRAKIKYPSYTHKKGDNDFLLWRMRFMQAWELNGDTDADARGQAKFSMAEDAGSLVWDLSPRDFATASAFLDALEDRFVPRSDANLAKTSFDKSRTKA